jgi:hypothetical protein
MHKNRMYNAVHQAGPRPPRRVSLVRIGTASSSFVFWRGN